MIGVTIIHVGELKEDWLRQAAAEYSKRLGAYCSLSFKSIKEARLTDNPSGAQIKAALEDEGQKIAQSLPARAFFIALCIDGKEMSSEELSSLVSSLPVKGYSGLALVIGGSHGLSEEVKAACQLRLSFSPMTFPHQLARIMALEQLYRAFSIAGGGKYHK